MKKDAARGAVPAGPLSDAWAVLARSGWLARRSPEVRGRLFEFARPMTFDGGDYLFFAGDEADGIYGLVHGGFDVCIPRVDGEEYPIFRAEKGFWIGDLALFAGERRLVSVRAATRTHVVHLPQAGLASLVDRYPAMIADFYQLSYENMGTALMLLGNLAVTGAENRVALRLLMHAEMNTHDGGWITISQKTLAELVALSQQTVRRSLRRLQDLGLIEAGYGRMKIIDRAGLSRLCGYTTARAGHA